MSMEQNDFMALNATLALTSITGDLQLDKDRQAAKAYFLDHVNPNTVFFHNIEERLTYLVEKGYYDPSVLSQYSSKGAYINKFVLSVFAKAYSYKFRFPGFVSAYKFHNSYAMKTTDGTRYLERYEDRVVMTALVLGNGDRQLVNDLVDEMIQGRFQPATPTFGNAGKKQRGEYVSCFLLNLTDNMESIGEAVRSSLQLSKRGGGVALCLTNLRERGASLKKQKNKVSGVVPVMKILEDTFSYANQMGQRQGAGAVYLHMCHPDIVEFLDTKRENADEKIRIKTLSMGVVVPDVAFELARENKDMYLFSPQDIQEVYGIPMADISITEKYAEMVDNAAIRKKKVNARDLFTRMAEIQAESGYPYLMFDDTVNREHANAGRVKMSNLCSEIIQASTDAVFDDKAGYSVVGKDISCNLGSQNIAKVMDGGNLAKSVEIGIRALSAVSDLSNISIVPSIKAGNDASHSIGLGHMNLHGFLARELIEYGSAESVEFTSCFFAAIAYYSVYASCLIAQERGKTYEGFEDSKYASGEYFDKYTNRSWLPTNPIVKGLFERFNITLPTVSDWEQLKQNVMEYGIYNKYLRAIPPTGSISYVNNSTSSIHPITSQIEIRKEGSLGRVYYPAPYLSNENKHLYQDAYKVGPYKLIDVYAAAAPHIDQGISATLFFKSTVTTRDINRAQIYAWKKGLKTVYYIRLNDESESLENTVSSECVACSL